MSDPTYTIWHPTLQKDTEDGSVIGINVTPGAYDRMPTGPKSFFKMLLEDIGIDADPKHWEILTYRSNYHGEPSKTASWKEKWPINWQIMITLFTTLSEFYLDDSEYFETYAFTGEPVWYPEKLDEKTACLVISDFKTKTDAMKAKNMINNSTSIKKMMQELEIKTAPEFYSVNIGGIFFQLQIYLGEFPDSFYINRSTYAYLIERICQQSGGITSFDKRAIAWDEL